MIEARDIHVRKGGRQILANVSVKAGMGEMLVVIGPNGAGKSTLLSVLAGLLKPDSGDVQLDGRDIAAISPRELATRRAYLPQNPVCEWPISVERLVALGFGPTLPMFGGFAPAQDAAISAALAATDLTARRTQPATTLSGGEFARAMLARAMVATPDILIVDEPVTGLDPRHAMDGMARLSRYAAQGKLVIASLHDLTLAARHATRILALKDGRVLGDGAVSQTLTPGLIWDVFGVRGELRGQGPHAAVDLISTD